MSRQAALWALAALLGIALTAGITWATGQLTSQHIGLSSEPISAGSRLAPAVATKPTNTRSETGGRTTTTVRRSAPPASGPTTTGSAPPASTPSPEGSLPVTPRAPARLLRYGHAHAGFAHIGPVLRRGWARGPGPRRQQHEWREQWSAAAKAPAKAAAEVARATRAAVKAGVAAVAATTERRRLFAKALPAAGRCLHEHRGTVCVSTSKEPQMPSRATNARIAALATSLAAGVLAAFALRPSASGTAPPRTRAAGGRGPHAGHQAHRSHRSPRTAARGRVYGGALAEAAIAHRGDGHGRDRYERLTPRSRGCRNRRSTPRTRTSGASTGAVGTGATRTTGSAGAPVRTRTSGTPATGTPSRSGSAAPVRTRTSGSSGADSSGAGGSGGSGAVRTRTSGGGDGGGAVTMTEPRPDRRAAARRSPANLAFGDRCRGRELSRCAGSAHGARGERRRPSIAHERIELGARLASRPHGPTHDR